MYTLIPQLFLLGACTVHISHLDIPCLYFSTALRNEQANDSLNTADEISKDDETGMKFYKEDEDVDVEDEFLEDETALIGKTYI